MQTPKPKVAAAGIAGALTTVLVFGAEQVGLDITSEVAAAVATLIAFAAGYLKRDEQPPLPGSVAPVMGGTMTSGHNQD